MKFGFMMLLLSMASSAYSYTGHDLHKWLMERDPFGLGYIAGAVHILATVGAGSWCYGIKSDVDMTEINKLLLRTLELSKNWDPPAHHHVLIAISMAYPETPRPSPDSTCE